MTESERSDPLSGLSEDARQTMAQLLRMKPEQQKETARPLTAKGKAQRERRERERQSPTATTYGD
jgi:hypothetical protein